MISIVNTVLIIAGVLAGLVIIATTAVFISISNNVADEVSKNEVDDIVRDIYEISKGNKHGSID